MSDHLSDSDFRRIADVVGAHTGIRMPDAKRTMVEGRLRRRVQALGLDNVAAYCRYLFGEGGIEQEFVHLIDVVTTNKTDFFREPEHFDFLCEEAVPALLGDPRRGSGEMIKVWSAAASCGAEAYTIAMVLADLAPRLRNFRFAVLGTDICTEVLEQGAAAVYAEEMMAPVPPEMRRRYVMRSKDAACGKVRIVPELRRCVHFRRLNLIDASYPIDRDVDVIFCRNILIYFDRPTQHAVVSRLCGHLRPGGYLLLGHSESMAGAALPLIQVAPTIFRRE